MKRKSKRSIAQMRAKASARKTQPKAASAPKRGRAKSSREKVRAHRERMRAKGLRLVQIWVPEARTAEPGAEARRQSPQTGQSASAARQAWVDAMAPLPQGCAITFDDIADLAGSVDGLPPDLSANTKKYLRATGYGSKRSR
jgi:hypothetical protein